MDDILEYRRLEEAAMNAWPALRTTLFDGWVLRFADGYTKRANSVNPTYPANMSDFLIKVSACEEIYSRAGLPCIFRLTSFAAPTGLAELLNNRGYRYVDRSLVMRRALAEPLPVIRNGSSLRALAIEEWLEFYLTLSGASFDKSDGHLAILPNIQSDALFLTLWNEVSTSTIACGLAVVEQRVAGL